MRFLVLGGAGFIGRSIVHRLVSDAENQVTVFDKFKLNHAAPNLEMTTGEFSIDTDFDSITREVDVVIHGISTTSPRNFRGFDAEFRENVQPTIRLLDACVKNGVKKVIYLSSGGTVYGESTDGSPWKETDPCNPICAYGVHKLTVEKIMSVYTHTGQIKCEVMRIANPYGPEQATKGVGVIATFARQMLSGQPIHLIGDGKTRRDYIYIDDLVDAVQRLIQYKGTEEVFNVGTGVGTSVLDIMQSISEELGIAPQIEYQTDTGNDVADNILDISRLGCEMGFYPKYSVKVGIEETLKVLMSEGENR